LPLPDGVHVTPTALVLPEHMPVAEWLSLGRSLSQAERHLLWWLGDWWHYGLHSYGHRKALVTAKKAFGRGYAFGTLMNFGSVAGSIETSRRREVLSWSHHVEVAKFKPEDQERWLDIAVSDKLSVKKLRRKIFAEDPLRWRDSSAEGEFRHYLRRLMRAVKKTHACYLVVPPWEDSSLEQFLGRHLQSNPSSESFAKLTKEVEFAAEFWGQTAQFFRRIESNVRANASRAAA
jgi:hypothetical protein